MPRCSSLPQIELCGQSAVKPALVINRRPDDLADLGSATHETVINEINGKDADIYPTATAWKVDWQALAKLHSMTWSLWSKVAKWFPEPRFTEFAMSWQDGDFSLTGHADVIRFVPPQIRILDFKTGWLDTDPRPQLKGYGVLALKSALVDNFDIRQLSVLGMTIRPRSHREPYEAWEWTHDELMEWWEEIKDRMVSQDYHHGEHCRRCPRWHECPAAKEMAKKAAQFLMDGEFPEGASLADGLIMLLDKIKVVRDACDEAKDVIDNHLAQNGTLVTADSKREIRLKREARKHILFGDISEPILRKKLGDRFPEAVTIGKTKCEEIVKDGVGKGRKTAAVIAFLEELEHAGVIRESFIEKVEVRRHESATTESTTAATSRAGNP